MELIPYIVVGAWGVGRIVWSRILAPRREARRVAAETRSGASPTGPSGGLD
jgi:hypothetical protein